MRRRALESLRFLRSLPWIACVAACGHAPNDHGVEWIPRKTSGQEADTLRVTRTCELLDLELTLLRVRGRPRFDHCVFELAACLEEPHGSQFLLASNQGQLCARAYCGNDVDDLLTVGLPAMVPRVQDREGGQLGWVGQARAVTLDEIVAKSGEPRLVVYQVGCPAYAEDALRTVQRLTGAGVRVLMTLGRDLGRKCPIPEGCRTCY